jgi:hypothetical protein
MGVHVIFAVLARIAGIERIEVIKGGESSYPCGSCSHNHEGKGVSDLLLWQWRDVSAFEAVGDGLAQRRSVFDLLQELTVLSNPLENKKEGKRGENRGKDIIREDKVRDDRRG